MAWQECKTPALIRISSHFPEFMYESRHLRVMKNWGWGEVTNRGTLLFLTRMDTVMSGLPLTLDERYLIHAGFVAKFPVAQTLGLVPCVHALQCICIMHMCQCVVTGAWWTERSPETEDWRLGPDVHGGKCMMGDVTQCCSLSQITPSFPPDTRMTTKGD